MTYPIIITADAHSNCYIFFYYFWTDHSPTNPLIIRREDPIRGWANHGCGKVETTFSWPAAVYIC